MEVEKLIIRVFLIIIILEFVIATIDQKKYFSREKLLVLFQ